MYVKYNSLKAAARYFGSPVYKRLKRMGPHIYWQIHKNYAFFKKAIDLVVYLVGRPDRVRQHHASTIIISLRRKS